MRNLIKFTFLTTLIGFLFASVFYFTKHRYYEQISFVQQDISKVYNGYSISQLESEFLSPGKQVGGADFSMFLSENASSVKRETIFGKIMVQNLEKSYKKLRSQVPEFGEMQDRLDPLSIIIESGSYDLQMLVEEIADPSILRQQTQDIFILSVPLSILKGAALHIRDGETLLLSEDKGALIANFGNLNIERATIKGWNIEKNQPAFYQDAEKFRPYIVSWCGANMNIVNSDIGYLGYNASKSYGLTYTSCHNTLYEEEYGALEGSSGKIVNSKIRGLYFGFYSYEANDIGIVGNHFDKSIVYGIDPHDRSKNLIIAKNEVTNTKEKHGIIISREVNNSYIVDNEVTGNTGSGIMLDRNSRNNIVANNVVQNNGGDGISIYESPDNTVRGNQFKNNEGVGIRVRNSWNILSVEDVLQSNEKGAVEIYTDKLKDRDLELDPYQERAGLELIAPEIIDYPDTVFKLNNFNRFVLRRPQIFKSNPKAYKGDLKGIENQISDVLYDGGSVVIER